MEGERRKRKLENEREEEESEEQQMEKFFALIKSTKEVRDLVAKEKKEKGVWNPTFQPEDFLSDEELAARIKISHPPAAAAAAGSSGEEKKEEGVERGSSSEATENENKQKAADDLDLKLSL